MSSPHIELFERYCFNRASKCSMSGMYVGMFYSFSQTFGTSRANFLFATVLFQQAEWNDILEQDTLPKNQKANDRVMQVC